MATKSGGNIDGNKATATEKGGGIYKFYSFYFSSFIKLYFSSKPNLCMERSHICLEQVFHKFNCAHNW